MQQLIERLKRVAPTSATVLIQGDNGTGKELIAQSIHQNSPRKNKKFVALNCAALSETILESELFGHVRGAFTDASHDRIGKFEEAHGGTLFLDEVGDMPMSTQIKLLRVLETGEISRVGSNELIKVNFRLISATNRHLDELVEERSFREDLYHRLAVVCLRLPRLADRTEDIPLLVDYFTRQMSRKHDKLIRGMSLPVRRRLLSHEWPGNVRQLRNVLESMVVLDIDGVLDVDDLPDELADRRLEILPPGLTGGISSTIVGAQSVPLGAGSLTGLIGKSLTDVEKLFMSETLKATGGNREEAARLLRISERTLYRKIKEYGL
jgi:two-component system response regulator HydG